jgi:hypothetical protein
MRPAAVITSYVLYAYSAELQLLARQALNTFAILQVRSGLIVIRGERCLLPLTLVHFFMGAQCGAGFIVQLEGGLASCKARATSMLLYTCVE